MLDDTALEPDDPALEDSPLEGADSLLEGVGSAVVLAAGSAPPATGAAGLAAKRAAAATVSVAGAADFAFVNPADAATPPPEGGELAAAGEFCAGTEAAAGSGCVAGWAAVLAGVAALVEAGWLVGAAPVTALPAEPTTELAALVTEPTALVSGLPEAEVPVDAGPVTAEAPDVIAEFSPGCLSCVAAWACLEKISSRKRIPAATIANCAARTAARFASSCGIDSSYPHGTSPYTAGAAKAPDKPCTADEDEAFCTATTVHHSSAARQAIRRGAYARRTWLYPYDQNDLR